MVYCARYRQYFYESDEKMSIEQIRSRLADANLKRVAERAGLHPSALYRLMRGHSVPRHKTMQALSDYLTNTKQK